MKEERKGRRKESDKALPSTVQYSTVQDSTAQHNTVQHSTEYSTVQCSVTKFRAVQINTVGTIQNSIVHKRTVQQHSRV